MTCQTCNGTGLSPAPPGDIAQTWPCDDCGMTGKIDGQGDSDMDAEAIAKQLETEWYLRNGSRGDLIRRIADAIASARRTTLEEAAGIADEKANDWISDSGQSACKEIAKTIRQRMGQR